MPTQLTVILLLVAGLLGVGWYAKVQTERAAVAQAAVADAQAAGEAWRLALAQQTEHSDRQADQLAESVKGYDDLRTDTDRRIREHENAIIRNKDAADWSRLPVPEHHAKRMCEYADEGSGEDRLSQDPQAVHGPAEDSAACAFTTGDLWKWSERLIEVIGRANQDRESVRRRDDAHSLP